MAFGETKAATPGLAQARSTRNAEEESVSDQSLKLLHSNRVQVGDRRYTFEVEEVANGVRQLVVSESRKVGSEWRRKRVRVSAEDLPAFLGGLSAAAAHIRPQVPPRSGTYSVEEIRTRHPRAYEPWSEEEEARLRARHAGGVPVAELAAEFGRQPSAIRGRLVRLGRVAGR